MTDDDPVLAQLTSPGSAYEITHEVVLGVDMQVYVKRMRTLREPVAQSAARADVDFVVQDEDRLTIGQHDARARAVASALSRPS